MKTILKYLLLFSSILAFYSLKAQHNLDSLLGVASKNNPQLQAKYSKYQADLQKVQQAGALPDLDVSFGYFIEPMELASGNQLAQIQVMQMFPWFGLLKVSKNEASLMALSSYEGYNIEKQELFYSVKSNYYQIYLVQQEINLYDTTLLLLKSIENLVLNKIGTINTENPSQTNITENNSPTDNQMGMNQNIQPTKPKENVMAYQSMKNNSSTLSDLLKIQMEIKELENQLASLRSKKRMLNIQLNTLLNRNEDKEFEINDDLAYPEYDYQNPGLFDSIKIHNPMIKMNRTDAEAYKQRQIMNRKMGYPMIGLGINYSIISKNNMSSSKMNGKDMLMPMVNLKLPIYRKKYKALVEESKLMENYSNQKLSNTENMLYMEFWEYQTNIENAKRTIAIYQDILSLAKKNFDILMIQFTSSQTDFDTLIRQQNQLIEFKINIIQAKTELYTAIAGIQKLMNQ